MCKFAAYFFLLLLASEVDAGLDDEFVYSSKFGLLRETVTTSWTAAESGLSFGGQLNGIPRDTSEDLYYYNGKLAVVAMNYQLEPLTFESERAYERWTVEAVNALKTKALKTYGKPESDTLNCPQVAPFDVCRGQIIWRGEKKVFALVVRLTNFDQYQQAYFGLSKEFSFSYHYYSAADFDLLSARLPSLVAARNEREARRLRNALQRILNAELRREKLTLEEFLAQHLSPYARVQEILRNSSNDYVGGVKANYTPSRWARSFRLQ